MNISNAEYTEIRDYTRASRELTGWISGARIMALLFGAADAGVLNALRAQRTPEQIAEVTGLGAETITDLCLALEAHGVALRDGHSYRLTPDYALLDSPSAAIPLAKLIDQSRIFTQNLQELVPSSATYTTMPPADVLAMAEGAGISALSSSPHVSPDVIANCMPELRGAWENGSHHLEVGCGVGNALLGIVSTFPKVTAVGIEIEELTAVEAQRRAQVLGIADRVEVRHADACDLEEEAAYDTVQWSQFFFPVPSREIVLPAMRRALKTGGYLFMPWLGSVSDDSMAKRGAMLGMALRALRSGGLSFAPFLLDFLGDNAKRRKKERRFGALQRLLFRKWGVPVLSVGELEAEAAAAGFNVLRTIRSPSSQFALTRGFLLAQR